MFQRTQSQQKAAPPNKRKYFRVPLRLKVDVDAGMAVTLPAMVVDISGGGCQIASRIMVESGQRMAYTLQRTEGKRDLHLSGRVATKRYSEAEHLFFYGIKFEGMKEAEHDALLQEITALERRIIMHRRGESDERALAKKPPAVVLTAAGRKKAESARKAFRVAWPFEVSFKIPSIPGTQRATVLDISAGGMRIATDLILRREWVLELNFTMPDQVLEALEQSTPVHTSIFNNAFSQQKRVIKQKPFSPIAVHANVVPGVQQSRGRYVHGVQFMDADSLMREEITRFVHAAQLAKRRLTV